MSAVTANAQAKAGDYLVLKGDTFTISGCAFTLPNGAPHPCVSVNWVKSALNAKAAGDFVLAEDSTGLCLAADQTPQGTVMIQSTQAKVSGR